MLHEIRRQCAIDVVTDPVREPDEIVEIYKDIVSILSETGSSISSELRQHTYCARKEGTLTHVAVRVVIAETVNDEVLEWIGAIQASEHVCLKEVLALDFAAWGLRWFIVQPIGELVVVTGSVESWHCAECVSSDI